jgi:bifunctional ADP-heptose synthase (sugar kinase/adenylyltransferase)
LPSIGRFHEFHGFHFFHDSNKHMMTPDRLEEILAKFPSLRIGILGDFCLDRYFDIDTSIEEVSLETYRPSHQVVRVRCFPGGAGTVTNNLHALGVGNLFAIGPVGDDGEAYTLKQRLDAMGVDRENLLPHPDYLTPSYNKPMKMLESGYEEQDRLDIRSRGPLLPELEQGLIASIEKLFPSLDGLIVLDQFDERNEHAVTDKVRGRVEELAAKAPNKIVFADSRARIGEFRNMTLKPNEHEAAKALGLSEAPSDLSETQRGGMKLSANCGRPAFVTLGEKGILLCDSEKGAAHPVPGFKVPPPLDICGAGDSTTSGIVAGLCATASTVEAAILGCLVASITVQQVGVTGTASPEQVLNRLNEYNTAR